MNAPAVAVDQAIETDGWRNIGVIALLLALGLASLGLLFRTETETAVLTWEASTAYIHGFLIIPVVVYMLWDRREDLSGLRAEPRPIAALAGLPAACIWLAAERLGVMEGRQLMVVAFAEVLFLSVLGWRLFRAMSGPLLYLFFLVPFGAFLTPSPRDITTIFIRHGLGLIGIPADIDGDTIKIPEGTFDVAEVFAGPRFLVASIAFGVLYALMMYRSTTRRVVFIVVSIVVPIIANGFHALGIVVLGHILGSAEAAADHIPHGWIVFFIIILLLTVMGLPFREDLGRRPPPAPGPEAGMLPMIPGFAAVAAVVAVAAISPVAALGLERLGAVRPATPVALTAPDGCVMITMGGVVDRAGGGRLLPMRARCGVAEYDITLETFSARSTAGPIMAERRRVTRPLASENVSERPIMDEAGRDTRWRLVRSTDPYHLAAARVWIAGEPIDVGLGMRIQQAKASVLGSSHAPTLMVVRPNTEMEKATTDQRREAERLLSAFLISLPGLDARVRTMARVPD